MPGLTNRATLEAFKLEAMPNGFVTIAPERIRIAQGSIKDRTYGTLIAPLDAKGVLPCRYHPDYTLPPPFQAAPVGVSRLYAFTMCRRVA